MSHNCQKSLHWLYVCGENPLPHSETFVIPVQLYQENNLLRQKQEKSIINTQIFQGSRLGKVLDPFFPLLILHKKWSFSLKIPSVNVAKSAEIWGFGKIYSRNCYWKILFFVQCKMLMPWEAKKEYLQIKYQRADKRIYEPDWNFIFTFWIMGLRTNQNKTFKSHQEGTNAAVYYGHKEFFIRSKG